MATIILLAHNEAATIQHELRAFQRDVVSRIPGAQFVVAEDGSRDGTPALIEQLRGELDLQLRTSPERLGYARALVEAVRATSSDYVFVCDGGNKHDPSDFWALWARRNDADLVVGRKTNRQDQLYRRMLTKAFNAVIRTYFGVKVHDIDSGMRLYSRRVVEEVFNGPLFFKGFASAEIVLRAIDRGFRYAEVPISYRQRIGESRGLPLRSIGRQVMTVLGNLRRLRRELRGGQRLRATIRS